MTAACWEAAVVTFSMLYCLVSVNDDSSSGVSVAAARPYVRKQTESANNVQHDWGFGRAWRGGHTEQNNKQEVKKKETQLRDVRKKRTRVKNFTVHHHISIRQKSTAWKKLIFILLKSQSCKKKSTLCFFSVLLLCTPSTEGLCFTAPLSERQSTCTAVPRTVS